MKGWLDLLRSLGEALLEVLRAELGALQADLKRSGRHLGAGAALLGAAAVLAFWAVGLIVFVLVTLLAVWLPLWGAALAVLALFLLGAGLLAWLGKRRLQEVESPVDSVRRRLDDHMAWWQESFLARPGRLEFDPQREAGGRDLEEPEEEDWE